MNHFFKSRNSDIVLLKLGNLHQNAKRYEPRNIECEVHIYRIAKRDDAPYFFLYSRVHVCLPAQNRKKHKKPNISLFCAGRHTWTSLYNQTSRMGFRGRKFKFYFEMKQFCHLKLKISTLSKIVQCLMLRNINFFYSNNVTALKESKILF